MADWVAEVFHKNAIERIFLYPGGTIAPLINACLKIGIKVECFKSEQGAGYAALAYARLTGTPQVVMVTSGPGVTNVMSPLADAYYDSTPLILVTGQIGTGDLKVRKEVRQRGFQETPTVDLTLPISKRATCMMSLEDVFREVPNAFRLAVEGRKGPVVIDFPMDIQRLELSSDELSSESIPDLSGREDNVVAENSLIMADVVSAAAKAKRPVLLLGQGAINAGVFDQYIEIAKAMNAVVVTSFLGVGSYDSSDSNYLGYVGHTGHLAANRAVYECDFLLVLGSRLDVRQTGTVVDNFVPNGNVAWVDTDKAELTNPRVRIKWKIELDIAIFCSEFFSVYKGKVGSIDTAWHENMLLIKGEQLEDRPKEESGYLQPRTVLQCLSSVVGNAAMTVVTGVGCHQHWAARHLNYRPGICSLLTSGGHGTMGYDLPSAIGAAIAQPGRRVLCIVGDGSLLMNIQELGSLSDRNLDVKILVMNNSRLGMVSQFQLITWDSDPTTGDFKSPDFAAIAKGFGIPADRLDSAAELESKISAFWSKSGPALLDVNIDPRADVVPMLLGGQHMGEMWMGRK
ncbi:MAG: thiamine pyrophosphate-binding protein [Methylobacter sp.]|uniref:Thiamine pyrophosphate-binding protein n=1 Tax=Candidatus Methylobacter titanis TaxID=3053457 RepID=A0AA43TL16_9GAMM|nr:thiamine pyrophosphate-binding protein [Candidatus Methylobacter titanis]